MKCSKKIKLLSSLSTAVVATSLIATSCAVVTKNNNNNDAAVNSTDISTIVGVKRSLYNSTSEDEIENIVFNDNIPTFARYEGLEDVVNISATVGDDTVTISINGDGTIYTSSTSGTSSCKTPTQDLIDINTLNGKMREFYNAANSTEVVTAIQSDNGGSSGAQISNGNGINIDVAISDTNISINITVDNTSTIYTGCVRGSAGIEKYEDWTGTIQDEGFKANSKLYAYKQGRQVIVRFSGKRPTICSEKQYFDFSAVANEGRPKDFSASTPLINYSGGYSVGMAGIRADGGFRMYTYTSVAASKDVAFTLTYFIG